MVELFCLVHSKNKVIGDVREDFSKKKISLRGEEERSKVGVAWLGGTGFYISGKVERS